MSSKTALYYKNNPDKQEAHRTKMREYYRKNKGRLCAKKRHDNELTRRRRLFEHHRVITQTKDDSSVM